MKKETKKTSRYGKVGLNVGPFGRWSRLVYAILILTPITIQLIQDLSNFRSISLYGFALLYFVFITLIYTLVYILFGNFFSKANPWINTLIFVGPPILIAYWNFSFAAVFGFSIPEAFLLALLVYFGISLAIQWKIKYGGCEVVAIPILFTKKRYVTYCVPIVAIDAVEKAVIDRKNG